MHIEKSEIKYDDIESFDLTPIEIVPKADTAIESKKLGKGNILDCYIRYHGTTRSK
jgi:hypothetical protein